MTPGILDPAHGDAAAADRDRIYTALRRFIAAHALDEDDSELGAATPLLEWGLLESLTIMRMLELIERDFAVRVPISELNGANLSNLAAITDMVMRLSASG